MGKRRSDADHRRFLDEFPSVRVSRFRANGTIDPAKRTAIIAFPDGSTKLIGVGHTHLKYGGGWSYFVCPKCTKLAQTLYFIDGKPLCWRCCDRLNIRHRGKWGMGREERMRATDLHLDQLIAKLETRERLKLKPAPASWQGKAKLVYRSRRLTERMRRRMITLRLHQLEITTLVTGMVNAANVLGPVRRDGRDVFLPDSAMAWNTHDLPSGFGSHRAAE